MSDENKNINNDIIKVINESVAAGISEGITKGMKELERIQEEKRLKQSDTRKYNTEMLLKNYRNFKEHISKSVYSSNQVIGLAKEKADFEIDFDEPMDDTYIKSIIKSKTVTRLLLEQIDTFLEYYLTKCMTSERPEIKRRGKVIELLYIEKQEKTFEMISEELGISVKTVNRDRKIAIKELSVLFFGIEGLKIK